VETFQHTGADFGVVMGGRSSLRIGSHGSPPALGGGIFIPTSLEPLRRTIPFVDGDNGLLMKQAVLKGEARRGVDEKDLATLCEDDAYGAKMMVRLSLKNIFVGHFCFLFV
jgi:hypothetical protein